MLIRITQKSEGIEKYLEYGKKSGREMSRDELDYRVHISGDMKAFSEAINYTRKNKKWKNHYWHITASFAVEDGYIDNETIQKINDEMMDYYFSAYDKNKIIHSCEAHRPRIQSTIDKSTGEHRQRLLHFHNAVSKYDVKNGNQIRMIPFKLEADQAFQSYLCQKYNLLDPVDRKRVQKISKKDIIKRWKADAYTAKQTKVSELRKLFVHLLEDVKSISDVYSILNKTGLVKSLSFKNQKSGNKYIQVQTNIETRNINIRGKGFEHIEKLYYNNDELEKRNLDGKYSEQNNALKKTIDENKEVFDKHKNWFIKEQKKRTPKQKINYKITSNKYRNYYAKYTREQRKYFVVYRNSIQEEIIAGYQLFNKLNQKYLFNKKSGVKIYDTPSKIILDIPSDPTARENAVRLCLQIAISKGWNLKKIVVSGSIEFRNEVEKQVQQIIENTTKKTLVNDSDTHTYVEEKITLNAASSALKDAREQKQERMSKEEIDKLKRKLDAESVIQFAAEKKCLLSEHFEVTSDNKIKDNRTRLKPKSTIDFLTKSCNMSFTDALSHLQEMYAEQQLHSTDVTFNIR